MARQQGHTRLTAYGQIDGDKKMKYTHQKYQKEMNEIRRKTDPTISKGYSMVPSDSIRCNNLTAAFFKKYAKSYRTETNELCRGKEQVIVFVDAEGDDIGGYYVQPYEISGVLREILDIQ